jgi:hypothetical protein
MGRQQQEVLPVAAERKGMEETAGDVCRRIIEEAKVI